MTAPERLDDAEREALAEWFHAQWCNSAHHRAEFCRMQVASLDADKADALLASDWLAQRVARAVAEAKAEAWAEMWDESIPQVRALIERMIARRDRAVREAKAEALREARDALYRGEGPRVLGYNGRSDIVYGEWLSKRADREGQS